MTPKVLRVLPRHCDDRDNEEPVPPDPGVRLPCAVVLPTGLPTQTSRRLELSVGSLRVFAFGEKAPVGLC